MTDDYAAEPIPGGEALPSVSAADEALLMSSGDPGREVVVEYTTFDSPPVGLSLEGIVADLATLEGLPDPIRRHPEPTPLGGWRWRVADGITAEHHARAIDLADVGSVDDLLDELFRSPFVEGRPRWDVWLVESDGVVGLAVRYDLTLVGDGDHPLLTDVLFGDAEWPDGHLETEQSGESQSASDPLGFVESLVESVVSPNGLARLLNRAADAVEAVVDRVVGTSADIAPSPQPPSVARVTLDGAHIATMAAGAAVEPIDVVLAAIGPALRAARPTVPTPVAALPRLDDRVDGAVMSVATLSLATAIPDVIDSAKLIRTDRIASGVGDQRGQVVDVAAAARPSMSGSEPNPEFDVLVGRHDDVTEGGVRSAASSTVVVGPYIGPEVVTVVLSDGDGMTATVVADPSIVDLAVLSDTLAGLLAAPQPAKKKAAPKKASAKKASAKKASAKKNGAKKKAATKKSAAKKTPTKKKAAAKKAATKKKAAAKKAATKKRAAKKAPATKKKSATKKAPATRPPAKKKPPPRR